MQVIDQSSEEVVGELADILIHPDTGKIEGFFVEISNMFHSQSYFVSTLDIVRFGAYVYIANADKLSVPEDIIRLGPLLEDPRRFLYQKVKTERGRSIGTCHDVQFNTETMRCEWLFTKKLFTSGIAVPLSSVVEVTKQAIIVTGEDTPKGQKISKKKKSSLDIFEPIVEPATMKKNK